MIESANVPAQDPERILSAMRELMMQNPGEALPDHSAACKLDEYLSEVQDKYHADGPTLDGHGVPVFASYEQLYLMGLPIQSSDRPTLRERVRAPDKSLARKARKYLTLGAVYAQRETFRKQQADGLKWRNWLATFMTAADVRKMLELNRKGKV